MVVDTSELVDSTQHSNMIRSFRIASSCRAFPRFKLEGWSAGKEGCVIDGLPLSIERVLLSITSSVEDKTLLNVETNLFSLPPGL
jgi:hypothetical protein